MMLGWWCWVGENQEDFGGVLELEPGVLAFGLDGRYKEREIRDP